MKFNYKKLFIKLTFIMLVFSFKNATAQVINCSLLNGTYGGTIAATSGTAWTTYNNYGPGYYMQWPVLNGGSYAISTCGASIDDQITVWGGFNTNMLLYNDDNGPFCTGSAASGNFVPNLTNYVYMFITEYPCLQGGSSSINVLYRQNDNLSFTSSSASMCSGESRTLTANPVSVGSVPNSTFGDPGSFSGVGVVGNVFTAPTVSVATNFTITYSFGYVSKNQIITVNPGAGLSVAASSSFACNGYPFTLTASGANTYTWTGGISNGVAFNPTVSSVYTVTSTDGLGCKNFRTYSLDVGDVPSNQTFSLTPPSLCGAGIATVNLNNSEYGVLYSLVNASNNATLSAPVAGNGSSITINSNLIASTTTIGVQAAINPTNGALAFDGVDDYVTASNTVTSSQGTWEAWVYKNNWAVHNDDNLFGNGIPFPNSNSFYISLHPTVGLHFRYGSTNDPGNNFVSHILTQNLQASSWHHLAATWQTTSGTTSLVIYVDGYVMATSTASANISLGSTLYMGGANTSTIIAPFGPGKMDEIKVWNVARTPAQVAADMSSYVSGSIPNLAYYWNMEDAVGSGTAQNVAGSVNSATLTNMNTTTAWTSRPRAGCTINLPQTVTLTVNPSPTITVNSGYISPGGSFTMVPTGGVSYTYTPSGPIVSPTITSTYTVTGTSASGCTSTATSTVNVINATQLQPAFCAYTSTNTTEFIWADSLGTPSTQTNWRYRFKLVNGATTLTWTTNNEWPIMQFYLIPGYLPATTYTTSVAWSNDNGATFSAYGPTCTLTSPTATTQLSAGSCGSSPSSYNTLLFSNIVYGATQYEYRLIKTSLSYTQTLVKSNNNFVLSQFTGLVANTSYSVSVRVNMGSGFGAYGPSCIVTTPGAPTTQLSASSCGSSPATYNTLLFADAVGGASQYEYKLVNTGLSYTQTLVKSNNNFVLSQFTGLTNSTTYSVAVRVNMGSGFGSYGTSCNVTTPGAPTTSMQPTSCNITATSYTNQLLRAEIVGGATQYEFWLTNAGLGYSQTLVKSNNNFILSQFTGLQNSTTYSVQVRVNYNSIWGAYGTLCTVQTPATFMKAANTNLATNDIVSSELAKELAGIYTINNLDAITYPNPTNGSFGLSLTSYIATEKVSVAVFDATGKLLEQHSLAPSEVSTLNLGSQYAAGIYNVVITQSGQLKNIKVVKN